MREHQVQTLLKSYLQAKGWYVIRLNSGMIETKTGHRVRMSEVGTPDLMCFKEKTAYFDDGGTFDYVDLVFIEVKTPKNPKPTLMQEQKMKELESFGARCIIAHSLEELQELL